MTEASEPTRAAKATHFLRHVGKEDLAETLQLLSTQVHYHVVGDHALSGTFTGRDAVAGHLIEIAERTSGRLDPFKEEDVMVGVDHVSVLVNVRMQSKGVTFRGRYLILMRFDPHDKIDQVTVFFEDEAAISRFFGRSSDGLPDR